MRGTALSLGFAIGALALGCELDKSPGQGSEGIGRLDGAVDAAAPDDSGGSGGSDGGGAGDAGDDMLPEGGADSGGSACGAGCPAKTPVCLRESGRCVQCARDRDCVEPARAVCDVARHACVQCAEDGDCDGETPRCAADTRECVQCTQHADCGDSAAPRCDPASRRCVGCLGDEDCGGDAPVCDLEAQLCVQCLANEHCSDLAAPQCEGKACVPCTSHDACAGRPQTLCDLTAGSPTAGACVQCTVADESPCGGKVCDPQGLTCTDRPLASRATCEPCIADSECVAEHRCIAMQFGGAVRASAYCMKRLAAGCTRPYASEPIRRTSRSGAAADDYCGIDEQSTSCEAIAGLLLDAECADGSDQACARDGSLCRSVNGLANRCTYACTLAAQCPPGVSCGAGYCGGAAAHDP